jgi:hypothetical protein
MLETPESTALEFAKQCLEQEPGQRVQIFTFNNGDGLPIGHDEYVVVKMERKRFVSYPEPVSIPGTVMA